VTKAFGKKVILNNIDLKVYEGEAIGVNRSFWYGKIDHFTFSRRIICPDRGEVYIYGTKRQRTVEQGKIPSVSV
jgi:phospholipid/cholesterol/gamma-HCH transport system ATP-binding protein